MEYDYRKTKEFKFKSDNPNIYHLSRLLQKELKEKGIAWHNVVSDECVLDFGCCCETGDYDKRIPSNRVAQKDAINGFASHMEIEQKEIDSFIKKFLPH